MITIPLIRSWVHTQQERYSQVMQRVLSTLLVRATRMYSWERWVATCVGIAVATVVIAVIHHVANVEGLSIIYLIVIFWLAIVYGRGPAMLGAFLAFLTYDFFFISPIFTITISDPAGWVSLSVFLVAGLVTGQLTAEVRRREHLAVENQERIAILYRLAQTIADDLDPAHLLSALTRRVVEVFAPQGISTCALFLPDREGMPYLHAIAHAEDVPESARPTLDTPDWLEHVHMTWLVGKVRMMEHAGSAAASRASLIPLMSRHRVVGVMCLVGSQNSASLTHALHASPAERVAMPDVPFHIASQTGLFVAFCDQIALALDHAALQQEAMQAHVSQESERMKDAFLNAVTHDLRTPIAAIQAAVANLEQMEEPPSVQESNELADVIATSAKRLSRLVDNLLLISRLEAGVAPLHKEWYPIGDVISAALRQLRLSGQAQQHHFTIRLPDETLEVPIDQEQIERVILNLLENACKYSPPASDVCIVAQIQETSYEIELRIRDQGVGIPLAEQEAIFDRFYRLRQALPWTDMPPPQGTGLGLAICAEIIRRHGGRIWVESEPGAGAQFVFTLPLSSEDDSVTESVHSTSGEALS